jgi:hypothetical protein
MDAFRELGFDVDAIDMDEMVRSNGWLERQLTGKSLRTPKVYAFNRLLLEKARAGNYDIVWIERGLYVFPRVLEALKPLWGTILVYHNTDDPNANLSSFHRLMWRFLKRSLSLYDVHVTSNIHNVREMRELGFPHVHHMELCANEAIEFRGTLSAEERAARGASVGFIGHWEPRTERMLSRVAEAGVPLKIYGGGWDRAAANGVLVPAIQRRLVWGEEYAKTIASFDINLGIVSEWNRNHTASRTFQMPALGGFMIHQRNELVTRYFREDQEMVFFDSDDELVEKCRHYVEHPDERKRIAEAGRRRCVDSGYFELDRVKELLPLLEERLRARHP